MSASTPVPLDHPKLSEVMDTIGCHNAPIVVPLHSSPRPASNCYWNVDAQTAEHGGVAVIGWLLRMRPRAYICAEHHSVWQDNNGSMWDVTANSFGDSGAKHTVFMPDDRIHVRLTQPPNIRSVYFSLGQHASVKRLVFAYLEKHAIEQEVSNIYFSAGYRAEEQFARAGRNIGSPSLNIRAADEKKLNALMLKHKTVMDRLGKISREFK